MPVTRGAKAKETSDLEEALRQSELQETAKNETNISLMARDATSSAKTLLDPPTPPKAEVHSQNVAPEFGSELDMIDILQNKGSKIQDNDGTSEMMNSLSIQLKETTIIERKASKHEPAIKTATAITVQAMLPESATGLSSEAAEDVVHGSQGDNTEELPGATMEVAEQSDVIMGASADTTVIEVKEITVNEIAEDDSAANSLSGNIGIASDLSHGPVISRVRKESKVSKAKAPRKKQPAQKKSPVAQLSDGIKGGYILQEEEITQDVVEPAGNAQGRNLRRRKARADGKPMVPRWYLW